MSTTPEVTPQRVADAYCKTLDTIDSIRAEADAKIAEIQKIQENRYNWLRENGFPMAFLVEVYVRDRERDRLLTQEVDKVIKPLQAEREQAMAAVLKTNNSDKFSATGWGTVFPTLKESVTVEDWDLFVEKTLLAPVAKELIKVVQEALCDARREEPDGDFEGNIYEALRSTLPLNLLNKAVSKTVVLEKMGDMEDVLGADGKKTGEKKRPNGDAIPSGIKYTAFRTVQVRKA